MVRLMLRCPLHGDIASEAPQTLGSSLYLFLLVCSGSSRGGAGSSIGSLGYRRPPWNLHPRAFSAHLSLIGGVRAPTASEIHCLGLCPCPCFSCCTRKGGSSRYTNYPVLPGALPSSGGHQALHPPIEPWDWGSPSNLLLFLEERGSQDMLLFLHCTPLGGRCLVQLRGHSEGEVAASLDPGDSAPRP